MLAVTCICDAVGCTNSIIVDLDTTDNVDEDELTEYGWTNVRGNHYCEHHSKKEDEE